jgi:hypothetical protein
VAALVCDLALCLAHFLISSSWQLYYTFIHNCCMRQMTAHIRNKTTVQVPYYSEQNTAYSLRNHSIMQSRAWESTILKALNNHKKWSNFGPHLKSLGWTKKRCDTVTRYFRSFPSWFSDERKKCLSEQTSLMLTRLAQQERAKFVVGMSSYYVRTSADWGFSLFLLVSPG